MKDFLTQLDEKSEYSVNESKSLIEFEGMMTTESVYQSLEFRLRDDFLSNLFDTLRNDTPERIISSEPSEDLKPRSENFAQFSDKIILQGWKNIENISARLIEHSDNQVTLECLIDKENGIYEERVFRRSLFNNYDLEVGNLFYLRFFERPNEIKLEIHDDPDLIHKDDFPKLDFVTNFGHSKLFTKK